VRSRQRPLREPVELPLGAYILRLTPEATKRIVRSARARGGDHNHRRALVERLVLAELWDDWKAARGRAARRGLRVDQPAVDEQFEAELDALGLGEPDDDPDTGAVDEPDPNDGDTPTTAFVDEMRSRRELRRVLDRIWPVLGPDDLLRDLYGSPGLLRAAARRSDVAEEEAATLHRPRSEVGWSEADLPLLDEARTLLGPTRRRRRRSAAPPTPDLMAEQMVARVMEDVEANTTVLSSMDEGLLHAIETRVRDTVLGQVRADGGDADGELRTYGHVVVDEAQELSAMAWRMLRRRCPRRSLTVVGDLDQAASPGAAPSWDVALAALGDPPGSVVRFTVNYRTPQPVMELAASLVGSDVRSARTGGEPPRLVGFGDDVVATVVAEVERLEGTDPGQVAVVAPRSLVPALAAGLGVPEETADIGGVRRILLDPRRAKGLEFDSVVVVDPAAIAATNRRDLYVSLTRTTDRLTVVGPLPPT
jgi:hypothetical protein